MAQGTPNSPTPKTGSSSSPPHPDQVDVTKDQKSAPDPDPVRLQKPKATFPQFSFLPEEIRRMIWMEAMKGPPRVHFLSLGPSLQLQYPGRLQDPADATKFKHAALGRELGVIVDTCTHSFHEEQWRMPGCRKYNRFFHFATPLNSVCPESQGVVQRYKKKQREKGLVFKKGCRARVHESHDIFCFRGEAWRMPLFFPGPKTTCLLTTRPRLAPTSIAIELVVDKRPNFVLGEGEDDDHHDQATERFPPWLKKALEWGREAKEEEASGVKVAIKPPEDSLAINLKDLKTIFLLSYGIKHQEEEEEEDQDVDQGEKNPGAASKPRPVPAHHYTDIADGMESYFYILDPQDQVMKHWDVPDYISPIVKETQRFIGSSDVWKVNVKLMARVFKKPLLSPSRRIIKTATAALEELEVRCMA